MLGTPAPRGFDRGGHRQLLWAIRSDGMPSYFRDLLGKACRILRDRASRRTPLSQIGTAGGGRTGRSRCRLSRSAPCMTTVLFVQAQALADDDKRKLAGIAAGDWSLTGGLRLYRRPCERSGGPLTFLDKFLPAEFAVKRRLVRCISEVFGRA